MLSVPATDVITGMYPNPSAGMLNISLEKPITGSVEVLDIQGKILYSQDFKGNQFTTEVDLNSGVYFVRVRQNDGILATRKWVITRN